MGCALLWLSENHFQDPCVSFVRLMSFVRGCGRAWAQILLGEWCDFLKQVEIDAGTMVGACLADSSF